MYAAMKLSIRAALDWAKWRVGRPSYPAGDELLVHLGCGAVDVPGFVNIDARPARHVHHVQGIERLGMFADGSVSLIYASHCLEHVPHRKVLEVLREWCRVLRRGGVVRLSVPDFDLMLAIYEQTGRDIRNIQMPLMGSQNYRQNFHYTCFNEAELTRLLVQAGFTAPARWMPGDGPLRTFPDWSGREIQIGDRAFPISLNLEAVKG